MLLCYELGVPHLLETNDIWQIYHSLGVAAAQKAHLKMMTSVISDGVHRCHTSLLNASMFFKGAPNSLSRYSMRNVDVGVLSKATFEESVDNIVSASVRGEREDNRGVSSQIVSGQLPKIGTGMFGLRMDVDKLLVGKVVEREVPSTPFVMY